MAFSCLSAATSPSMAPRIATPSSCNRFFLSDFHPSVSNFGSGQENHLVSSPFFPKAALCAYRGGTDPHEPRLLEASSPGALMGPRRH